MNKLFIKINIYNVTGAQGVSFTNAYDDVISLFIHADKELCCVAKNLFNGKGCLDTGIRKLNILASCAEVNSVHFAVKVLILDRAKL